MIGIKTRTLGVTVGWEDNFIVVGSWAFYNSVYTLVKYKKYFNPESQGFLALV